MEVFPLLSTHAGLCILNLEKVPCNPYPGFLFPMSYQYGFTIEIRFLLFLFLCVSHLPLFQTKEVFETKDSQ